MERILIIGGNGAGKSTFSYALAEKRKLPLIHIDRIYWYGSWQVTPQEEFQRRVLEEARKPRWIIEGNNVRSLAQRLEHADTVFWFDFPPIVCVKNILLREWKYRGRARPDMPATCISQLQAGFLRSAWNFNRKNRSAIRHLLESWPDIRVIRFTNRRQVKKYLKAI